ncbi:N-formylglutamate amidohydrolase [Candidatus Saccharibacteria bacterium]|nr:N-formylglutamate amidohydrolase [Candidatus Saccharibacteria bacterium]
MNNFSTKIKNLEREEDSTYEMVVGTLPVILVSAHGIGQKKRNGRFKLAEPYTRGIAKYVSEKTGCFYLVKNQDTGIDPNKENHDEFKAFLKDVISRNNIKLMVDLHGAKKDRDFDVEIGTLNGESANPELVEKLIKNLKKQGIKNIAENDPFKGGDITKTIHESTGIDCIQLEINYNYRNIRKIRNLNKICRALASFIKD